MHKAKEGRRKKKKICMGLDAVDTPHLRTVSVQRGLNVNFFPPLFRSFPHTHTHTSSTLTNGCVKDTDSTLVQLLFLNERVVRDCCIIVALYNRATLDKLQCRERRRNARNEIKK